MSRQIRHEDGFAPNVVALGYTFGGYPAGVFLLTLDAWYWNLGGVLLTAHALVLSAYLVHELAHQTLFVGRRANRAVGRVLCWINGACFASFDDLAARHLRHHADRVDVVTFDYRTMLRRAPAGLRTLVLALEWAYVPAVELLMRGLVIALPFRHESRRDQRGRTVMVLAVRVTLFVALGLYSLRALLLYAVAYLLFLQVLRFMDAFQHTFEVFPILDPVPAAPRIRRDARYEYAHTYSNLLSERWPWLDLLVLNFGYHNAHHARPGEPWYRLPVLHRQLFGPKDPQVLPCRKLLPGYHRHRLARVMADDYGIVDTARGDAGNFLGAVGVSFLTTV